MIDDFFHFHFHFHFHYLFFFLSILLLLFYFILFSQSDSWKDSLNVRKDKLGAGKRQGSVSSFNSLPPSNPEVDPKGNLDRFFYCGKKY